MVYRKSGNYLYFQFTRLLNPVRKRIFRRWFIPPEHCDSPLRRLRIAYARGNGAGTVGQVDGVR
jgi:hypothetical protein